MTENVFGEEQRLCPARAQGFLSLCYLPFSLFYGVRKRASGKKKLSLKREAEKGFEIRELNFAQGKERKKIDMTPERLQARKAFSFSFISFSLLPSHSLSISKSANLFFWLKVGFSHKASYQIFSFVLFSSLTAKKLFFSFYPAGVQNYDAKARLVYVFLSSLPKK